MSLPPLQRIVKFLRGQYIYLRPRPLVLLNRRVARSAFWFLPFCLGLLLIVSSNRTIAATDLNQAFQTALEYAQQQYGFPGAMAAYVLPDGTVGLPPQG